MGDKTRILFGQITNQCKIGKKLYGYTSEPSKRNLNSIVSKQNACWHLTKVKNQKRKRLKNKQKMPLWLQRYKGD